MARLAERALDIFPKLYFFVPPPTRRTVRTRQAALIVTEPVRAVLCLMDVIRAERGVSNVAYRHLSRVLQRLYPKDKVSKTVAALIQAGCIEPTYTSDHRPRPAIQLTNFGLQVLTEIKEEQSAFVKALLDQIPAGQRASYLSALEGLAGAAWQQMKSGEPRRTRGKRDSQR